MTESNRIGVEPLSFGLTGFTVGDLFVKTFKEELKKELPTSLLLHFCIGFPDSRVIISVSHSRREGKYILERVDVEGTDSKMTKQVMEVLKKVLV